MQNIHMYFNFHVIQPKSTPFCSHWTRFLARKCTLNVFDAGTPPRTPLGSLQHFQGPLDVFDGPLRDREGGAGRGGKRREVGVAKKGKGMNTPCSPLKRKVVYKFVSARVVCNL